MQNSKNGTNICSEITSTKSCSLTDSPPEIAATPAGVRISPAAPGFEPKVPGPAPLIAKGRLYRKRLGGGMRQVGVLAAACLIALEETPPRLVGDHANARFLAEGLARIPGIAIDPSKVVTNIAVFDIGGTGVAPAEISARLKQRGVLINYINENQMRAVTHYGVDREACAQALGAMADAVAS